MAFEQKAEICRAFPRLGDRETMRRKPKRWQPVLGGMADYIGRSSRVLRRGCPVMMVGECRSGWVAVRAIGRNGQPARFTVLRNNLGPMQPQLF